MPIENSGATQLNRPLRMHLWTQRDSLAFAIS